MDRRVENLFLPLLFVLLVTICGTLFPKSPQCDPEVLRWLADNNLNHLHVQLTQAGARKLSDILSLEDDLPIEKGIMEQLRKELLLHTYLSEKGYAITCSRLREIGLLYLEQVSNLEEKPDNIDQDLWLAISKDSRNSIGSNEQSIQSFSTKVFVFFTVTLPMLMVVGSCSLLVWLGWVIWRMTGQDRIKKCVYRVLFGRSVAPERSVTTFHWDEPAVVGNAVSFDIKFFQTSGKAYPISDGDNVQINIFRGVHQVNVLKELGGTSDEELNTARCKFTVRQAGDYTISILVGSSHIKGSPFFRTFSAGPPDPSKFVIVQHNSMLVCMTDSPHYLLIEPRDTYGNLCHFTDQPADIDNYSINITTTAESKVNVNPNSLVTYDQITKRIQIRFTIYESAYYEACTTYCGKTLPRGLFNIIVLNSDDMEQVRTGISKSSSEEHVVFIMQPRSWPDKHYAKAKKVYCSVTPKQLVLYEYVLWLFPSRVATFRLNRATQFKFAFALYDTADNKNSKGRMQLAPVVTIDDGCQPPLHIASSSIYIILATFAQFLLQNFGGSEKFTDKQHHFYYELRKHHRKRSHQSLELKIARQDLLDASMRVTKSYSTADWCRRFEIHFIGEHGIDWGGVRREWVDLLCKTLFEPSYQLFSTFHDRSQALVHPNPNRPKHLKLKHYEFAGRIVGKCLYESALGGSFLSVKARFTRSFLAQIIGLRVHYKHFESDDPDFYNGLIKHLINNDPSTLDPIYFVDETISPDGQSKSVELVPGGSECLVTEKNKLKYLDALAQYRLASKVRPEIDSFLAGLNATIPPNFLSIFDENELELLVCGMEKYDIKDFKLHHVTSGSSVEFKRVLHWFWSAVSNFTDEEMARLLQFTTGCSRLPPGGFGLLTPKFEITFHYNFGSLPRAHTCFNQLCLSDHETFETFEKALLLAIREGCEGFSFS